MPGSLDASQQRADDVVRRHPLALMAWDALARGDAGPDAERTDAGPLRVGELRYEHRNGSAGQVLRLPATVGHHEQARHLLVARPPALAARAASLLNALTLRFAVARPPGREVLVVDEFEDTRGIPAALRALRGRVATFPPAYAANWLRDREGAAPLVVAHATRLAGTADYEDEAYHAFAPAALEALVDRLRARGPGGPLVALAFDPADPHHPVRRAFDDRAVPAVRVRLGAAPGSDEYDGAAYANLALRFTPDAYPAEDRVPALLAAGG